MKFYGSNPEVRLSGKEDVLAISGGVKDILLRHREKGGKEENGKQRKYK